MSERTTQSLLGGIWIAASLMALGCHPSASAMPTPSPSSTSSKTNATALKQAHDEPYIAKLDGNHALVGTLWDTTTNSQIDLATLASRLAISDVILLGEKHDHPDHHRLQAALISQIASDHPTVAFEMIDVDQQNTVDRVLGAPGSANTRDLATQRADALASETQWEKRGWPSWSMYRPVMVEALLGGGSILGANYPKDATRALVRGGGNVDPDTAKRLGLDRELPAGQQSALDEELKASHCGHMPDAMLGPMGKAQRARDGQMAEIIVQGLSKSKKAVLIAGAGHVRRDRGVPWVLSSMKPSARSLSIAFVEVSAGANSLADYSARYSAKTMPFDVVWFTPRLDDNDPCEAFHKK
ncbi:MAG: ChaN family lipoprotein [Polyangiaceae bacterium]